MGVSRAVNAGGVPFAEDRARTRAGRAWDRCYYPPGAARHLLAVLASGDLTPALAEMTVPTFVIHGALDPLINVSGGKATAGAIPGSQLIIVPDMGHALAPTVWPTVINAIAEHAGEHGPARQGQAEGGRR